MTNIIFSCFASVFQVLLGAPLLGGMWAAAVYGSTPIPQGSGQTVAYPSWIPVELMDPSSDLVRHGYQRGFADAWTTKKIVTLRWRAGQLVNSPPGSSQVLPIPMEQASQEQVVGYFPTAICAVGSAAFVVAGVKNDGGTIIERWDLSWPDVMPAPPSTPTGPPGVVNVVLPRIQRNVIYSANESGKLRVKGMSEVKRDGAPATSLLLHFDDSHDVWQLALDGSSWQLVLSPTNAQASLGVQPVLSVRYYKGLADMGERIGCGYVYRMRAMTVPKSFANWPETLFLVDADKDGQLDQVNVVPASGLFGPGGWMDYSTYPDWWK